eukprot:TRINITY_DN66218_c13_g2_i1.p1 TRINITY_DN66218_c13_g2~~TRINITY_DN66218_c13_g2_i1.p1  ORF type:complete len:571 (-),score=303.10 TRINITY_DN66218_c13_g2_i1:220-1932(-)
MMLGIRTATGLVESKPAHELSMVDFEYTDHYRFPSEGTRVTPAHSGRDFKFKDYAPYVFRDLRERWGIEPQDYIMTVCAGGAKYQYLEFITNSKSGQFFFYTFDQKFMIKTVSKGEKTKLMSILQHYHTHVMTYNDTLLTRFYGMHRVHPHKKRDFYFLIFASVFGTDKYIHKVFDLKGSLHGRKATEAEIKRGNPVYKDKDFLRQDIKIRVGPARAKLLKAQLAADADFLCQLNIMDYSLLLGIHYRDQPVPKRHVVRQSLFTQDSTDNLNEAPKDVSAAATDDKADAAADDGVEDPNAPAADQDVSTSKTTRATTTAATTAAAAAEEEEEETTAKTASADDEAKHQEDDDAEHKTEEEARAAISPELVKHHSKSDMFSRSRVGSSRRVQSASAAPPDDEATMEVKAIRKSSAAKRNASTIVANEDVSLASAPRIRGQSSFKVPARWDKVSQAADIGFKADRIRPLLERELSQPHKTRRKVKKQGHGSDAERERLFTREDGGIQGVDENGEPNNEIYYMGIIDILTVYGTAKRFETAFKSIRYDKSKISAVNPRMYADRFKEFLNRAIV